MEQIKDKLEKTLEMMGIKSFNIAIDNEHRRISITVENEQAFQDNLSSVVTNFNYLTRLFGKKFGEEPVIVDINNYRKERESLITDLARAAARKAASTGEFVQLPAMNSYERLLVHQELATRPDVATESVGQGKERAIVVKPI